MEESGGAKERLVGATIGESFIEPPGLFEIECIKRIYETLRSLEASRRSRVIQYVAQILGDED